MRITKKWTLIDTQHPISLFAFSGVWIPSLKSGDCFLHTKIEGTHFKLSNAALSVSMKHCRTFYAYRSVHRESISKNSNKMTLQSTLLFPVSSDTPTTTVDTHCLCTTDAVSTVNWAPDDGHGICPKHVERLKLNNNVLCSVILLEFFLKSRKYLWYLRSHEDALLLHDIMASGKSENRAWGVYGTTMPLTQNEN
jgi:hypothetical protein